MYVLWFRGLRGAGAIDGGESARESMVLFKFLLEAEIVYLYFEDT